MSKLMKKINSPSPKKKNNSVLFYVKKKNIHLYKFYYNNPFE